MVEVLRALDEKARQKLAKTARDVRREFRERVANPELVESDRELTKEEQEQQRLALRSVSATMSSAPTAPKTWTYYKVYEDEPGCAALAMLGVGTWNDVRKINPYAFEFGFRPVIRKSETDPAWVNRGDIADDTAELLLTRRPEWLSQWVEERLAAREVRSEMQWPLLRRLVRDGGVGVSSWPIYLRLMAWSHAGVPVWSIRKEGPPNRIVEALRADAGLLTDELPRALAYEGDGEPIFPAEIGESGEGEQTWLAALTGLAADGTIARDYLLDVTLSGLAKPQEKEHASWLTRLHDRLQPTDEEAAAREAAYIELLGDPSEFVAAFGGRYLLRIEPRDHDRIASRMEALFRGKHKGPAELGLKLAKRYGVAAAPAVVEGLVHPKSSIQNEAIKFLESVCTTADARLAEIVERRAQDVSASIAPRVAALARRLQHGEDVDLAPIAVTSKAAARLPELRAQAQRLSNHRGLGIDELLRGEFVPVRVNPLDVTRLHRAVAPIRDLDELIDGLLRQRQFHIETDEWERLLDGLSRLAEPHRRELDQRFALVLVGEQPSAFAALLHARQGVSMSAEPPKSDMPWRDQGPRLRHFVHARLFEVAERIRAGRAEPVVAMPTHAGGWIDGRVLVERLRRNPEPGLYDLVQALLRLAPDGRVEALRAAEPLSTRAGAALRWALGAPKRPVGLGMALLVAASRARDPLGDVEGVPGCGPDGTEAARYGWRFFPVVPWNERERGKHYHDRDYVAVEVSPPLAERENDARLVETPTILQHRRRLPTEWWTNDGDVLDPPLRGLWPLNPDSILAWGVVQISNDIQASASPYLRRSAYLQPLFDGNTPFSEIAQVLLTVSFGAADADVRVSAVDAAVALTNDGRMTGDEVGTIAARLIPTGIVKLNRLADALGEIARTNALCGFVAANIAQAVLAAGAPERPLPLLERLRELLAELDSSLRPDARSTVELLAKASGKTAAAASDLLARAGAGRRDEIVALALEGRITRARRQESRG